MTGACVSTWKQYTRTEWLHVCVSSVRVTACSAYSCNSVVSGCACLQGEPHAVSVALEIINDAVTRYKELYEGCLQGLCAMLLHSPCMLDAQNSGCKSRCHAGGSVTGLMSVWVPAGQCVSQVQPIHDIKFMYQPPPRNAVPHAAALSISNQR